MPTLNWIGKDAVIRHHKEVPFRLLEVEPELSCGNVTLTIQQGYDDDGTPYGTIPRLLMYWMTTEALRSKSPKLELGNSLAAFMEEIGLDHRGKGVRSDRVRLQDQMRRLFEARISFTTRTEVDGQVGEPGEQECQ